MAKVTKQRAGKDYPAEGIKKGEEYYSWSPGFRGATRRSKTPPRPSQTTDNPFLVAYYGVQEQIEDANAAADDPDKPLPTPDEAAAARDGWVEELNAAAEELDEKFNNMPEGLQGGDTGQTMQERVEAAQTWAGELENIDFDYEDELPDGADDEDKAEAMRERIQNKFQECLDADPGSV